MRPLWSWIAQCNAYRVIDDDRFVGSRRIFLSGVVSWVWWNLLIRKISFLNELYARMFLLCLFSRIGVDYFNIEEFYFLVEDLQIKSLFYSLVYRFGFLIEERKYERSLDHRTFIPGIDPCAFWKMDSANGGNFIHSVVLKKYIQEEMYKKIVKLKHFWFPRFCWIHMW